MIRAAVLSGHRSQYREFLRLNNLKKKEFLEIKSIKQLEENPNVPILECGTYWLNPLYERVKQWQEKRK